MKSHMNWVHITYWAFWQGLQTKDKRYALRATVPWWRLLSSPLKHLSHLSTALPGTLNGKSISLAWHLKSSSRWPKLASSSYFSCAGQTELISPWTHSSQLPCDCAPCFLLECSPHLLQLQTAHLFTNPQFTSPVCETFCGPPGGCAVFLPAVLSLHSDAS